MKKNPRLATSMLLPPLANVPGFAPTFKWRVDSDWATATLAFVDELPDEGGDLFNPAMLDYPY